MTSPQAVHVVREEELRRLFNHHRFWERVKSGELTAVVKRNHKANPDTSGQPDGTRSQIIRYFDASGNKVAVVHQYLLQDGTIGAGRKPDPKWLYIEGHVYFIVQTTASIP